MKRLLIVVLAGLCVIVYSVLVFKIVFPSLRADSSDSIDVEDVTQDSRVVIYPGVSNIALFTAPDGVLYETSGSGVAGVTEFLAEEPQVESEELLPENIQQQARMFRQTKTGNEEHYFYQQTVNGVPIYASQLVVHQRSGNQIYSLQGNVISDSKVWSGLLTDTDARTIALTEARKETDAVVEVTDTAKIIFNGLAIGVNEDPNNYMTFAVTVMAVNPADIFGRKYFISTVDGAVLFSEQVVHEAMNRQINDCNHSTNCARSRYEGDPAQGKQMIDSSYDNSGTFYNFLKNSFNQDSFDGHGAPLIANIDYWAPDDCPNAYSVGDEVYLCRELVAADVLVHEYTHAMTAAGPNLIYSNQSGAINEALSDIYSYAIDNNWTMGESTQLGSVRSMQNPPQYGQPDTLFSTRYYCGNNDEGGVHTNGGILAKAFYLMVSGGSFNSCTINAIGKDKAYAVLHRAEMSYMTASSNYKTVYNAMIQACGDLYGGTSSDCIQVRNSLRAVQMDQQPDGNQKSPKCSGGQAQTPNCSAPPEPTNPPGATATPNPQPTVPGATSAPVPTTGPQQSVSFDVKIRFQGVFDKPSDASQVPVQVRLTGGGISGSSGTKSVSFNWQEGGVLQGKFTIDGVRLGSGYVLYLKGPLHLERKICDTAPIEIFEGKYSCWGNTLTLTAGTNEIDATGILQLAGDVPDDTGKQDNVINSYDLSLIRNNYNTQNASLIKRLDVNYDGTVTSKDYELANLSSSVILEK